MLAGELYNAQDPELQGERRRCRELCRRFNESAEDPDERRCGLEAGHPVSIGADVWVGGGAIILPGVTIGDGTVIGAGSVVTRSLPSRVVAAGNPCRVIRPLQAKE
jgi:acetyltransferase-like isoleucine patch superfamily enzyme